MDEIFPRPTIRTYSRAGQTTRNTRENRMKDVYSTQDELKKQTKASKEEDSKTAKGSGRKTTPQKSTVQTRSLQHGHLKQGKQVSRKPSAVGVKKGPVLTHRNLASKLSMKAEDKVTSWLEKSKDWMKPTETCSAASDDAEGEEVAEPSIEIMRGEENISGIERRKKLFSGLDFHPSCVPLKPGMKEDPRLKNEKQSFFDSLTLTMKPGKKSIKRRDDTPAAISNGTMMAGTPMETCDETSEDTGTGYADTEVVSIPHQATQSSSTIHKSQSIQVSDRRRVKKYLSSTGRTNISVTPKFPELSAISMSDNSAVQKLAETTPKPSTDFKVPQSPSKYHSKGSRRGKLEPKHSTQLFTTGCAEIVDAFSTISPILPACTTPSRAHKVSKVNLLASKSSPAIEDPHNDVQLGHNKVKTSTPNKSGKQARLDFFEVDVSSVEVDSGDEDLHINQSSREINSEDIIHLSDIMIEPNQGPLSKNQDLVKKPSEETGKQAQSPIVSQSAKGSSDIDRVSLNMVETEVHAGKENSYDAYEKSCQRMERLKTLIGERTMFREISRSLNLESMFTIKKKLKRKMSEKTPNKRLGKYKVCTLMDEPFKCPRFCQNLLRGREIIQTDYNTFIKNCPIDDLQ